MHAVLDDRSLIRLSGADARSWLQDIVTSDIEGLGEGEIGGCALLSPQGKILFDFLVCKTGDNDLLIDCARDQAAPLAQRLTLYRLRAKVALSEPCPVAAVITAIAGPETLRDMRFKTDIFRRHGDDAPGLRTDYDAARIAQGITEGGRDYPLGDIFPHDANLDQTRAVGFRKGCYVGQEVVSRMQHRGTARKRPVVVNGTGLASGLAVTTASGTVLGSIGTVAGDAALAIVRLDRVAEILQAGEPIVVNGSPVSVRVPDGVTYSLDVVGHSDD